MKETQITSETVAKWRAWAQKRYGSDSELVEAASGAAIAALQQGYSPEEAAKAGRAAAARINRTDSPEPRNVAGAVGKLGPAPPGKIVGVARQVKPMTQLMSGFQILDFELERPDGPPVRVQVRGKMINGRIDNGDEIVVDKPADDSRFIQTDRVFNRSWNSLVNAPKDDYFDTPFIEAMQGKKIARLNRRVRIGALVYAVVFIVLFVCFAIFMGYQFITFNDHDPAAPAWFCEQAQKTGVENAPGC
jgi:hypothetical protein